MLLQTSNQFQGLSLQTHLNYHECRQLSWTERDTHTHPT